MRIRINNFRSFKNVELDLDRINVITGKNDSGKSNIIRAIEYLFGVINYSEEDRSIFTSEADVVEYHIPQNEVGLYSNLRNDNTISKLSRSINKYYLEGQFGKQAFDLLNIKDFVPIIQFVDISSIYNSYDLLKNWSDLEKEIMSLLLDNKDHVVSNYEYTINQYIERYWSSDNNSELFINSSGLCDARDKDRIRVNLANRGTGFQVFIYYIIRVLKALNQKSRKQILIFEEPERMLHPQAQRDLFNFLKDISANSDMCIIITTHSAIFVNSCMSRSNSKVFLFEKNSSGNTIINQKPFHNNWKPLRLALGIYPCDSFVIGKVTILVEGICEKICLPKLINKFTDIDIQYLNFIDCNGAGNMYPVLNMVKDLLTSVIAVVDGDNAGDQSISKMSKIITNENICSLKKKEEREKDVAFEDIFNEELRSEALVKIYDSEKINIEEFNIMVKNEENQKLAWSVVAKKYLVAQKVITEDDSLNKLDICNYMVEACKELPKAIDPLLTKIKSLINK